MGNDLKGETGARGAVGARGSRGEIGKWKLSLGISALALLVSLGGNISLSRYAHNAHSANRQLIRQECQDTNALRDITRRALNAAIVRASAALPNVAAAASIVELRREIAILDGNRICA